MSSKKRQETRFSLDSPVITVGKESTSVSSRSANTTEKSIIILRKPLPVSSNLLPYTPPDALMFPLFSAIQRRAWMRARKLCYELILSDPLRKDHRDLYARIDQIIKIMNQRVRPPPPPPVPSRTITASSRNTDEGTTIRRK